MPDFGNIRKVSGNVERMTAVLGDFQGETCRSADLSSRVLELLPQDRPSLRWGIADNLGSAQVLSGGMGVAITALGQAVELTSSCMA